MRNSRIWLTYIRATPREIGVIFSVRDMEIDYFHLGVHPIFRQQYAVGNAEIRSKGYEITDRCIGCGKCADNCPQRCIEAGSPYRISQNHCLHCGGCYKSCPVQAVEKRVGRMTQDLREERK